MIKRFKKVFDEIFTLLVGIIILSLSYGLSVYAVTKEVWWPFIILALIWGIFIWAISDRVINRGRDTKKKSFMAVAAMVNLSIDKIEGFDALNLDEILDAIKKLSDGEILTLAVQRPGHPGAYGFILNQRIVSNDHFPAITAALMHRLGDVKIPENDWGMYIEVARKIVSGKL